MQPSHTVASDFKQSIADNHIRRVGLRGRHRFHPGQLLYLAHLSPSAYGSFLRLSARFGAGGHDSKGSILPVHRAAVE